MSKMFIMNDGEIPLTLMDMMDAVQSYPNVNAQSLARVISCLENPEWQDPLSIYETDPALAEHTDESTRECFLFGMAFDDKWCKDDVYIIMVHESGNAWIRHY